MHIVSFKSRCFIFLLQVTGAIFTLSYAADTKVYYHAFPMGQGSSSFVRYHSADGKNDWGVVFDMGSSSTNVHKKFHFQNKEDVHLLRLKAPDDEKDASTALERGFAENKEGSQPSSSGSDASRGGDGLVVETSEQIKSTIKEALKGIKTLLVFLSHPDKDHINYFSKETIADDINVIAFLGGDWLNGAYVRAEEKKVSSPVTQVLDFLKERDASKTYYSLPYYWGEGYKRIKQELADNKPWDQKTFFHKNRLCRSPSAPFFTGASKELMEESKKHEALPDAMLKAVGAIPNLDLVHVWAMNYVSEDVNNQSLVVSCTVPEVKTSFVFTGDAHEECFHRILGSTEGDIVRRKYDGGGTNQIPLDEHMLLLTLPHHGSVKNMSPSMLKAFPFNIAMIPAGNGMMYPTEPHPSYKLVEDLEEWSKQAAVKKYKEQVWKKYAITDAGSSMLLVKKDEEDVTGKIKKLKIDECVILCTNIDHYLTMRADGFYKRYDDVVVIQKDGKTHKFKPQLTHRVLIRNKPCTTVSYGNEKYTKEKEDEDNDVTVYRTEDVSKVLICVKVTDKEFFFYDAKKL